jgi:uncharacterized surface protein with fasciclin (FAS1) repeats
MRNRLALILAASALTLSACDNKAETTPKSEAARDAAGGSTIASDLGADSAKFAEAAKAAGIDTTLAGPGPYTVLVPSDAAFEKLPAGALDTLMKPEGRPQLTKVLTYHILSGAVLKEDIAKAIKAGAGKTQLMTVGGEPLTATENGGNIVIADGGGAKATLTATDEKHSNGVVHHVDTVLMPG